jgi:NodT family efflux transporter outer membrane factor (OMF) lipoprotein
MFTRTRSAILTFALLAAGCAPKMQLQVAPEVLSSDWSGMDGAAAYASASDRSHLGAALGSAELSRLIDRALVQNPDVAIATARIDQARALLRIARSAMLPTVSASAGLSANRTDRPSDPFDFSNGFAGLDVSYELDLFGRGSAERRAGMERMRAAGFDRQSALLVIEAEVARAYVQRAALSDRMALLDRNIAQAAELERIIRARLNAGAANRVDLGLQTIQLRQLQTEKVRLAEALDQTRTALAVLAGEEAPRFQSAPAQLRAFTLPAFSPGSPGDLLTRRPDIRAAEARIQAAGGDVGQARAAFFPRLRLTGSGLAQAASFGGPLGSLLSMGADLLAPIFNRGALHGEFDGASARQRESVELYRRDLLSALAEVENALSSGRRSQERETLILQIVEEARLTARLARLSYIEGEADLRQVLDAESLLVQAEDARALVTQQRLEAAIDLFRATGGRAGA